MRIGSLLALVVAVVAIAVSSAAAVPVPGRVYDGSATTAQSVKGHPMRLAQIGLLTSYRWAQPGCAPVFTSHAQPWS
jgi:hypothetical protein